MHAPDGTQTPLGVRGGGSKLCGGGVTDRNCTSVSVLDPVGWFVSVEVWLYPDHTMAVHLSKWKTERKVNHP